VERGTHQQLLEAGGLYASMWNRQREAEAAREALALSGEGEVVLSRNPPQRDGIQGSAMPSDRATVEIIDAAE
jgi:ATP-binding cassette, subfamily B, heavy metal transporter